MNVILYGAQGSNSSERVEWTLNYKVIAYQRIEVTNAELHSSYLQINPFGYVPAISIDDHVISESMAIIECLEELFPDSPLLGRSIFHRAAIREICEYVNSSIHSPQNRSVLKALRPEFAEQDKRQFRGEWITSCLQTLEVKLCQQSGFAVAADFSAADIFVATIYKKALQHGMKSVGFYDQHLNWLRRNRKISDAEPQV